jgi:protocatechuate 3,4-dioxygenase beta subunit
MSLMPFQPTGEQHEILRWHRGRLWLLTIQVAEKAALAQSCIRARLHRLLKNSFPQGFASGHDFSRAGKSFNFVIPSGLQPARDLLWGPFQHPLQSCRESLGFCHPLRTLVREGSAFVTCFAASLVVCFWPVAVPAQLSSNGSVYSTSNTPANATTEKFTVTGTVVDAVSGEPIRKALVQMNIMPRRSTFTDSGGRFQFEGVSAGSVSLTAQKPGYFPEPEASRSGVPQFDIGPNTAPLVVKLNPEAVIYGKVTTSDGTPLEHVTITLTHAEIRDGQRRWDNQGSANTDEDGHFRFANLRPGTYYVGAGPYTPQPENLLQIDEVPTTGYRGVYYPGAPDRASASPIQLSAGQQSAVDFSLSEAPVYRVSGVVTGYSPNQGVGLQVLDQSGVQVPVGVEFSPENGRFDVRGLPAGSYVLKANSQLGPNENVRAEVRFSLSQDLHNLHVGLTPAITIPVVVSTESQPSVGRTRRSNSQAFLAGPLVSMRLIASGPPAADAFASVEGQQDQQNLIFRNVDPGRYSARIDPNWPWYVASAQYGQTNLLTDDLVITAGAPAQELHITLRNDSARLTGTVHVPDGMTAPVTVIAVPQGEARTSPRITSFVPPPNRSRAANGDDFGLGLLAPGEYLVFAFDHIDNVEYLNPEVLQNYNSQAAHITLSANQHAQVALELIRTGEDTN